MCILNLAKTKSLRSRAHATIFVLISANYNSRNPLGDQVMPRAEVYATAQASHGNITVLSHLKHA